MGDGLVSQFLSLECGMVCMGCDAELDSFMRWKSLYQKMLQCPELKGKMIPACYYGDFCKMRSYTGAVIAYGWCKSGPDAESCMLDAFDVDPICKILIANWRAPDEFPEWYKDADVECNFELKGAFCNKSAKRTMCVHAKKDLKLKRLRRHVS